jgi:hypothetical protein
MSHINKDEFFRMLTDGLNDKQRLLDGKSVPVLLTPQEILLIEWALSDYQTNQALSDMLESMSELVTSPFDSEDRKRFQTRVTEAFKKPYESDRTVELLRNKLAESVDDELDRQKQQPDLGFN